MARTILRQETIDGVEYNVVKDDAITVYTGPSWLFDQFKDYTHQKKPWLKIVPVVDPDGKPIIGDSVFNDPNWDYLGENPITNPQGESRFLRDWLYPRKFVFYEPVDAVS
jgi:hypothetical protein